MEKQAWAELLLLHPQSVLTGPKLLANKFQFLHILNVIGF